MLILIKEKFNSILRENRTNYESIKISLIYLIFGFTWVYFSDRMANLLFRNRKILLIVNTYKGFMYIFLTSCILYLLINNLLKKIYLKEEQLKNSYTELEAYVQQLAASEEALRVQYDQIYENEQQISKSEEKSRAIIKAIPDVLFIINRQGVFLDCEANDESILLMSKEFFLGKSIAEVMPKQVSDLAYENLDLVFESGNLQSFEYELIDKGIVGYYEIRMVKKGKDKVLAMLRDITKRKELEKSLEFLSYNDQLTGLRNRRFYEEELKRLDVKENYPLTIILGDANGLKLINDSFGHEAGDEFIRTLAQIIKKGCQSEDIVARIGGDEFVVLLPKTDNYKAEQIIKNINNLVQNEKVQNIELSISFGYETKNHENEDINEIFKKAEDCMYKRKLLDSSCMRGKTVDTIMNTLNEKNKREEQHSVRVSELCKRMGESLELTERKIHELKIAGLLHDIGKIAIEENILNKPGKLTSDEVKEIRRHPEIGYRILSTVHEMSEIAQYVLLHHEMWNGNGYPKGLKGDNIPIESRIIAIADTYDAITSERSYRKALSKEFAIEQLKRNAGIQFDSKLVDIFIKKVLIKD
ncbi:HD domain-containing phosphohydrolase [Clostridium saccharobutylicum]|uniref:Cyclic di-GMP phosphodiesterase response regulator RpfG n=2 Tax=Clostridium saccharobutylicum TaxID=169679 RepID=U5MVJ0_CLOSA|nr:HD domain-containing phosphohydrolase [Clostridium saccharobutylicum]AGX43437.1 cyclic di-GMP phosphodiesterase response regulator RpfG [Clostridium saccharobutylicum DSM 13864]AQR90736.1 cyclic di-GMP phosphodiesterase response regulator RpfG [Clostridium saccharobutylicum]AQS00640.1 cyclic di-GMP phosphodiesterase response regulator RpfG [Clostridium saccharobutylicum]AQS14623.1 cyclic di-GMP phosphodiesterase response regulator RpfG [Clostridium saccharobutylicum]MBA8791757.1 diguanylate